MTETTEDIRVDSRVREQKQKERIDWRGRDFFFSTYGALYEDNESGTSLTLTTADSYYQWVSSEDCESSGVDYVVTSTTDDNIVIGINGEGIYFVSIEATLSGSNNSLIHGTLHINNVASEEILFHLKLSGNDHKSGSDSGLVKLSSGDDLDLRFSSDTSSTTLNIHHINLTIFRVSS